MRYAPDHKQQTRERVLKEAAKAIRSQGPEKVAVAAVMAKAGLTHGGFYAHFRSKDELVAAAIDKMFADGRELLASLRASRTPIEALGAYIDFYLSARHRDARSMGCPIPVLSADVPRLSDMARASFSAGVAGLTAALAQAMDEAGLPDAERMARSMLAEQAGALSLARAVDDPALSDALLETSRTALKRRLGLEDLA